MLPATQRRCISLKWNSWYQGTLTHTHTITQTRVLNHGARTFRSVTTGWKRMTYYNLGFIFCNPGQSFYQILKHCNHQSVKQVVGWTYLPCIQWRRWGCHLDSLYGEDVLSRQQLPPCSGIWNDDPGSGLRHRSPPLVWPEKRLRPDYVSFSVILEIRGCTFALHSVILSCMCSCKCIVVRTSFVFLPWQGREYKSIPAYWVGSQYTVEFWYRILIGSNTT